MKTKCSSNSVEKFFKFRGAHRLFDTKRTHLTAPNKALNLSGTAYLKKFLPEL